MGQKLCPLCVFEAPTVNSLLSHLRTVHSSDPHFRVSCGIAGCSTTANSFSALYSHVYRRHPDLIKKRKESGEPVSTQIGNAAISGSYCVFDPALGQCTYMSVSYSMVTA